MRRLLHKARPATSRVTWRPDWVRQPIDWLHIAIVLAVFSITGFLSALFSGFLLRDILQLEGGIWSGPWSYRIAYVVLITPSYSAMLVLVGTLAGKHTYFKQRVLRMWGRMLLKRGHRS